MYLAGLVFTLIGWAFQAYETVGKKTRNVSVILPAAYCAACILFGISSYMDNQLLYAGIDAVCAILAAIVFFMLVTHNK